MSGLAEVLTFQGVEPVEGVDGAVRSGLASPPIGAIRAAPGESSALEGMALQRGSLLGAIRGCPEDLRRFVVQESAIQEQYEEASRSIGSTTAEVHARILVRDAALGVIGRSLGALRLGTRFDEQYAALQDDRAHHEILTRDRSLFDRAAESSRREIKGRIANYLRRSVPRFARNMARLDGLSRAFTALRDFEREVEWSTADIGQTDSVIAYRDDEVRIGYPSLARDGVERFGRALRGVSVELDEIAEQIGVPEVRAAGDRIRRLSGDLFGGPVGEWGINDEFSSPNGAEIGEKISAAAWGAVGDARAAIERVVRTIEATVDGDVAVAAHALSVGSRFPRGEGAR